ncbi:MAG: Hsp20/alpha crystallin family protein [Chloroflexi bacterium]|nr:Hsp20/alpha crystallin family protein [Chloroflexota bacterium]
MLPLSWTPREMEAWRAFEEGELPRVMLPPRWPFGLTWARTPASEIRWAPLVEMWEKDAEFVVRAELPGVKKEDIEILTTKNTLTIGGTRAAPEDVRDEEYHRCEVCYGPFSRSITLPMDVDPDNVEASYENGVLEVHVPKAKEARATKIEIKSK